MISISAQRRFFFEGPKVSKGKRLETVGDRTFAPTVSDRFIFSERLIGPIPFIEG